MPALATAISRPPQRSTAAATAASTAALSPTSHATPAASMCSLARAAAAASAPAPSMSATSTLAPARPSACAHAKPMPGGRGGPRSSSLRRAVEAAAGGGRRAAGNERAQQAPRPPPPLQAPTLRAASHQRDFAREPRHVWRPDQAGGERSGLRRAQSALRLLLASGGGGSVGGAARQEVRSAEVAAAGRRSGVVEPHPPRQNLSIAAATCGDPVSPALQAAPARYHNTHRQCSRCKRGVPPAALRAAPTESPRGATAGRCRLSRRPRTRACSSDPENEQPPTRASSPGLRSSSPVSRCSTGGGRRRAAAPGGKRRGSWAGPCRAPAAHHRLPRTAAPRSRRPRPPKLAGESVQSSSARWKRPAPRLAPWAPPAHGPGSPHRATAALRCPGAPRPPPPAPLELRRAPGGPRPPSPPGWPTPA